jgi:glycosyltransferase involved in cell wall biosynthesis
MSEFLTEKKLFQETFGGTTFNHLIEWCKEKYNNKEKHNNLEHTIKNLIEWCKKKHYTYERHYAYEHTKNLIWEACEFASYVHYISEEIEKSYLNRQKIWNKNYFKFKGIDTDIFTPVYEYEEPYVDYFMFCGDDNRRIKFISLIVKHIDFFNKPNKWIIDFINKPNKWIVDPKSIKLQILNFGDESVTEPVIYLRKY